MNTDSALWHPPKEHWQRSGLHRYMRWLREHTGLRFERYDPLWEWSTTHVDAFWESLLQYFDVQYDGSYEAVRTGESMPGVRWFEGIRLSYAEHIFRHRSTERPAFISVREGQPPTEVGWDELERKVVMLCEHLQRLKVGPGDRVVGFLPNAAEAIISFLAVNSLGAVWSCASPDFGADTVIDRFEQVQPKVLIATDGYIYGGKRFDKLATVDRIRSSIASIKETILISYLDADARLGSHTSSWDQVMSVEPNGSLQCQRVPFDHPIWILYSSGTTGRPKAITHGHGGVLLEHLKYLTFHNDVRPGEHFFWFTTTGWMMWNFLQASMLVGGVPVLFDGSPGYPDLEALWKLAAHLPIHHFGTSAPFLIACMRAGLQPGRGHDLSHLRSIGSTGSPLPTEAFDWVYGAVKEDLWLCSMSGGTDVCTAFVGGVPSRPVKRGRIQGIALGCALEARGEDGTAVVAHLGEMVITQPMPSMPIYFWNDPEDERYRNSYFSTYPGVWKHGDWMVLYDDGSLVIHGRSDATLNRKGVRIGTAEIYAALDQLNALSDSLVINVEKPDGDDVMILFVVLKAPHVLAPMVEESIKNQLRSYCSPRHVPDKVVEVSDIPYTLSGKKMEVPVKKLLAGLTKEGDMQRDAIRNPEAMDFFLSYAPQFRALHKL